MQAIATTAAAKERSLWSSLAEAVRGSHQDYTAGDLNQAILLLAVHMVLEMLLECLPGWLSAGFLRVPLCPLW
jgi:hypothetical protein